MDVQLPPRGEPECPPITVDISRSWKRGFHFLMISKLSSAEPSSKRLISTWSLPAFWAKIERKQSSNHNEAL